MMLLFFWLNSTHQFVYTQISKMSRSVHCLQHFFFFSFRDIILSTQWTSQHVFNFHCSDEISLHTYEHEHELFINIYVIYLTLYLNFIFL